MVNREKAFDVIGWILIGTFVIWSAWNVHGVFVDIFQINWFVAVFPAIGAELFVVFLGLGVYLFRHWLAQSFALLLQISLAVAAIYTTHSVMLNPSQERTKQLQITKAKVVQLNNDIESYTKILNDKEEPLQQVCSPIQVGDKLVTRCTANAGDKNRSINNEALRKEKKRISAPNQNGLNELEQAKTDLTSATEEIAELQKEQERGRGGWLAFIFSSIPQIGNVIIPILLGLSRRKRLNNGDLITEVQNRPKSDSKSIRHYLDDAKRLAPTLLIYQKPISEYLKIAKTFLEDILSRVVIDDTPNTHGIGHYLRRAKEQFNDYWEKKEPALNTPLLEKILTTTELYNKLMKGF